MGYDPDMNEMPKIDAAAPPTGATSLTELLDAAAQQGHEREFVAVLDDGAPRLRCPHCDRLALPEATAQVWSSRLEGASDPADMAFVSALRCPNCRATGVYVTHYGPAVEDADAAVLPRLPEPGAPDRAPDRPDGDPGA